ncbi:MAG: ABC transporter substrate-binding protein [Myxococcales bacterium]|nr:ABC transporter substrate-binding protein [Myxococcales bacterium]
MRSGQTFRIPLLAGLLATAFQAAMLLGAGCSSTTQPPRIGKLPLITSGNAQAERDLSKARRAHESGNLPLAEAHYRAFVERHESDPLAPIAQLELGKLLLERGEIAEAHGYFQVVGIHPDPAVAEQGRFYGAVTDFRQGRARQAAETLRPMVGRTIDPRDTSLLLLTLAEAELALDHLVPAAIVLDQLARDPAAAAPDRDAAGHRLAELIDTRASASEVSAMLRDLSDEGAGFRHALRRALRDAQAARDTARAQELVEMMRSAGMALDGELAEIAASAAQPGEADPATVGAILSLSGRARVVGEVALRGLMLAADLPPKGPTHRGAPKVVFRDDGGDPEKAAQAVDELVSVHRAIAIVGPMNSDAARAAAERAEAIGVPMIALTPAANLVESGEHVFQLLPTAEAEVAALVDQAVGEGRKRFALLRPDGPYGDAMEGALEQVAGSRRVELIAVQSYPMDATAFGKQIAAIAALRPDALLVADAASRLALIAPALAAAGLWSGAPGARATDGGRVVQLLAPSVAFDHDMAEKSARYLQGALFAVAFDATTSTGPGREFADTYAAQFGSQPSAFAALAHDAYVLVRSVTSRGASTRDAVREGLRNVHSPEVAGAATGFDALGGPNTPTRLLRYVNDAFVPIH